MPDSNTPARMTVTDLQSDETVEVQFNPTELERAIAVNYARKEVLGNSHQEHEFLNVGNQTLRIELFYLAESPAQLDRLKDAERFLESLCYPPEEADAIATFAPPRVLMVWPRTLSITARLTSLRIRYQRWNRFGDPVQFTATCTFEESRIRRLTKQDVRLLGALRTPRSQNGGE